jgi:flagellar biosynthetic protein FliP
MATIEGAQVALAMEAPHAHHGGGHSRLRFAGHFVEMQLAMGVGMALGGPLGISGVAGTELRAALWLVAMILPMVAWMRFRGMPWRPTNEMSAAMAIPVLAALPLYWAGLIGASTVIGIEHMSMAPAMLVLMAVRRSDYGW